MFVYFFSESCKNYKNDLGQICKDVLLPAMQAATLQVTPTGRKMTEISTYIGGQHPTCFMDFKKPFSKLPHNYASGHFLSIRCLKTYLNREIGS